MNHPRNRFVPLSAIIGEVKPATAGPDATSLVVSDMLNGKPRPVILVRGQAIGTSENCLLFIPGFPSSELMSTQQAKARFAIKPDGSVVYSPRGSLDPGGNYNLLDIAAVIEANNPVAYPTGPS